MSSSTRASDRQPVTPEGTISNPVSSSTRASVARDARRSHRSVEGDDSPQGCVCERGKTLILYKPVFPLWVEVLVTSMIDLNLECSLQPPWEGETFRTSQVGPINFLVGPNGSGKSRFASTLLARLRTMGANARLLGTDRLSEMAWQRSISNSWGDHIATGLAKDQFDTFRAAGREGSGIDTIVLLEERMDLRIQIEATLSHLFDRDITLEWDSGYLLAKMGRRGRQESYRLDREECHGIKELMVLLTHLYDESHQYLIIDEPELNLHPQYQAFFMQEVRRIAGDPADGTGKKIVFLVTHSPYVLDLQTTDDLKSVVSFDLQYSTPKQVNNLGVDISSTSSFIRRLNAHHKQFFFSDNPIFVEGIHDAWLVEAMMEARGSTVAGAGSCIIDAGGAEGVNDFLKLCNGLGKQAHFLYDLDSLFSGRLRDRIRCDESIRRFLIEAGHGVELDRYCGDLEARLTDLIDDLLAKPTQDFLQPLVQLLRTFGATRSKWNKSCLPKARTAVVTALSWHKEDINVMDCTGVIPSKNAVLDIWAHVEQIAGALRNSNIHLLPGGTLERYLPCYGGDHYNLSADAKQQAVNGEITRLRSMVEYRNAKTDGELRDRYGDLYDVVCRLPSKTDVDVAPVLHNYLSKYIYELQRAVLRNAAWQLEQVQAHIAVGQKSISTVFAITTFERPASEKFTATIEVTEMMGRGKGIVQISDETNAGANDFDIVYPGQGLEPRI